MSTKQGQKGAPGHRTVKQIHIKRVVISFLLATVGLLVYAYAYQYTHQAKLEKQYNQVQQEIEAKNKSLLQSSKERQELEKKLKDLEAQLQAKKAEQARIAGVSQKRAQAAPVAVSGTKVDWMRAAGIPESEWQYVDYIVSRESGWNPNAVNKSSGACGLGQQLPCGKWAGAWNDPVAALRAQYGYVTARYGGYAGAYSFWLSNHWY